VNFELLALITFSRLQVTKEVLLTDSVFTGPPTYSIGGTD